MKLSEILSGIATIDPAAAALEIGGVTADSRAVKPGDLFVAIAGVKDDGMRFAADAAKGGAVAVVAERSDAALGIPVISVPNARRALSLAAAQLYPRQPATIAAITGTSGKTSVAAFTRQIWEAAAYAAASIGTIGVVSPKGESYGSLTTPDPVALHRMLDELAGEGVTHLAMEASSHGLDQHRLDGVRVAAGGFTNLSRDHLDYHPDLESYLAAKLRLFDELIVPGGAAVVSADHAESARVVAAAAARGLRVFTVGRDGDDLRIEKTRIDGYAQQLTLRFEGRRHELHLPLVGEFQIENALVAAGLAIVTGTASDTVFEAMEDLEGAKGRLEFAGRSGTAPVFIDYAHKPDALAKTLEALRPYVERQLVVVFGCGGDRDPGKRPMMGAIAAEKAERVIVTDDNPRSENPAAIRAAILAAAPGAVEIADRGEAIRRSISELQKGDVLVIAGKGHESGQIVGGTVLPFSDHETVAAALGGKNGMKVLWTVDAMAAAMRARSAGRLPGSIGGISIDSRTLATGDAFFAIAGDSRDGHAFVEAALKAGAGLAVVSAEKAGALAADAPLLVVDDVLDGLRDLARAGRARLAGKVIAVTGSVGKTSTKEALRLVLSREGETHASAASYNNHWGVPLSLARCPGDVRFAVFELGMNHAGEIGPLSQLVKPDIAIITTIAPVHLEYFASVDAIADAKAEIFEGLVAGGTAILNRDNAQFDRLAKRAGEARVSRIVSFGEAVDADARLVKCVLQPDVSTVQARILGDDVTYKLGAPGKHLVMNSLAVLAAAKLAGADLAMAAMALADLQPASGRGTRITLDVPGGRALLIDESYNANPVSMAAAIALLGQAEPGPRGRRIAVLGDMLELGAQSGELHAGLAAPIVDHAVDLVFCAGPAMRNLWEALPSNRRGGYANDSGTLEPQVLDAVSAGDAVMIKGSFGSKMTPIVKALQRRFAPGASIDAAQG